MGGVLTNRFSIVVYWRCLSLLPWLPGYDPVVFVDQRLSATGVDLRGPVSSPRPSCGYIKPDTAQSNTVLTEFRLTQISLLF